MNVAAGNLFGRLLHQAGAHIGGEKFAQRECLSIARYVLPEFAISIVLLTHAGGMVEEK